MTVDIHCIKEKAWILDESDNLIILAKALTDVDIRWHFFWATSITALTKGTIPEEARKSALTLHASRTRF